MRTTVRVPFDCRSSSAVLVYIQTGKGEPMPPSALAARRSAPRFNKNKEKKEPKILFQQFFKSVGPRTYAAQVKEAGSGICEGPPAAPGGQSQARPLLGQTSQRRRQDQPRSAKRRQRARARAGAGGIYDQEMSASKITA